MRIYDPSNPNQDLYNVKMRNLGTDLYFYKPKSGPQFASMVFFSQDGHHVAGHTNVYGFLQAETKSEHVL